MARMLIDLLISDCMVGDEMHLDGSEWVDDKDQCQTCKCHRGVVKCEKQPQTSCSNCSNSQCCPQCSHSSLHHEKPQKCLLFNDNDYPITEYHHGQKWLSQCQECECMVCNLNV